MSVERLACPKCGSNNFATQARCWSCGTALTAGAPAPGVPHSPLLTPHSPVSDSPSGLAIGAAVVLGLFFPLLAVPVGIVFLMLDDRKKTKIGWHNILWGTVGTVLHVVGTMALSAMLTPMLINAATRAAGQARGNVEQGAGMPSSGLPGQ